MNRDDGGIEKISSGSDLIRFYDVEMNKRILKPADSFLISIKYESEVDFEDVDIDIAILSGNELSFYFQATNRAYQKRINLKKGNHILRIEIIDLRLNNTTAKIAIAIWSKERGSLLFWWRIPVDFEGVDYSTGKTFLNVTYEISE
jgi:hypothetical protein